MSQVSLDEGVFQFCQHVKFSVSGYIIHQISSLFQAFRPWGASEFYTASARRKTRRKNEVRLGLLSLFSTLCTAAPPLKKIGKGRGGCTG